MNFGANPKANNQAEENIPGPEDADGVGYGRGGRRGKGRDGGGEYEMVGMKEHPNGAV